MIAPLEAILQEGCAESEIVLADPHRAARILLSMTSAEPTHGAAVGLDLARSDADIEGRIEFVLEILPNGRGA